MVKKSLCEFFMDSYFGNVPWRIYGNRSHRLLCKSYADLIKESCLDDMEIVSVTFRSSRRLGVYFRVVVSD